MPDEGAEEQQGEPRYAEQAKRLTERLLRIVENIGQQEPEYSLEPQGIYIADVEAAVERFAWQLWACREFGYGFPCLELEEAEPVPVDILGPYGPDTWRFWPPWLERYWLETMHLLWEAWRRGRRAKRPPHIFDFKISEHSLSETKGFFASHLVSFLTSRFRAQQFSGSASPGLRLKVVTHRHGLRVHYSPAYFFNPWNVFGSPTSPVYGWIHPGRYMFGAMGPRFPLTFDPANFDIPPCTEARLTTI
jgi:hypothetical protein